MKHEIKCYGGFMEWDDEAGVVSDVPGKKEAYDIDWINARFVEALTKPVFLSAPSCPPITLKDPAHNPSDFLELLYCAYPRRDWVELPPSLQEIDPTLSKWKPGPVNPETLPGMYY